MFDSDRCNRIAGTMQPPVSQAAVRRPNRRACSKAEHVPRCGKSKTRRATKLPTRAPFAITDGSETGLKNLADCAARVNRNTQRKQRSALAAWPAEQRTISTADPADQTYNRRRDNQIRGISPPIQVDPSVFPITARGLAPTKNIPKNMFVATTQWRKPQNQGNSEKGLDFGKNWRALLYTHEQRERLRPVSPKTIPGVSTGRREGGHYTTLPLPRQVENP